MKVRILQCTVLLFLFTALTLYGREKDTLKQIEEYTAEGKELYNEQYYIGAVEKWMQVLKIDPWNDEVKVLIEKALKKYEELTQKVEEGYLLLEEGEPQLAYKTFLYVKKKSSQKSKDLYALVVRGLRSTEELKNRERYLGIIEKGDTFLNQGKYDAARNIYHYAHKFFPGGTLSSERLVFLEEKVAEEKLKSTLQAIRDEAAGLFETGEYERSRLKWNELLALAHSDEEALLYLSKISYKEREKVKLLLLAKGYFEGGLKLYKDTLYEEAIDQFENAIAMNYRVEESKQTIEEIRHAISEKERAERERNTELVANYLREGIKYYNLNKYRKSLTELNQGLKLDPDNTQIREYILRDTIALRREEEKAVPSSSPFYRLIQDLSRLGTQAFEEGNYQESIRHWEEILLIFPFNEKARFYLTKAIAKTDPALADEILAGFYREAKSLIERGKKREAAVKLKLIAEANPDFRDAQAILRDLEKVQKKETVVITEEAKKKAEEYYDLGLEYYRDEQLEDAVKMWGKAVELNPQFIDARIFLSRAETKLRNLAKIGSVTEEEISSVNEELRIKIKKHYLDGINFYMDGLYNEAITEWEEVIKLDPTNENVRINIDRAKKRLSYEENQSSS